MLKKSCILLLFIAFALKVSTQEYQLIGVIKNIDQQPIANASVKLLKKDSTGNILFFAITNQNGAFNVSINNKVKLWLQISAVGYISFNNLLDSTKINVQITLKPFTGQLPEVNVKSDAVIIKKGDTTTYKVAAFEKGNESNIADLLAKLPGIQISDNGKISFNGKAITRVLLEQDDLVGSNYSGLINNTTINGLDKIDVIENYNDNTRIENSLSKGNEIVLNLRYKQKKIRIFSNIIAGLGLPTNTYELKLNSIGIYKKSKLIAFGNKNTIGNLATNLYGSVNENNGIVNENEKIPFALSNNYTPFNFSDATPLNISAFRVFNNNSLLSNVSYLLKPSTKLYFKTGVNIINDNYGQQNQLDQIYFQLPTNSIVIQTNAIAKSNKRINVINELNWKPNPNLQFLLISNYNSILNNQINSAVINSINQQQNIKQNLSERMIQFTATKVVNSDSYFQIQFLQNNRLQYSDFTFSNPAIDASFSVSASYKNILQQYHVPTNNTMFQLSWMKKTKKINLNIKLANGIEYFRFNNGAYAFNKTDSFAKFNTSYFNNDIVNINKKELNLGIANSGYNKFQGSFGVSLHYNKVAGNNSNFFILPKINIQYKLSERKTINLNLATTPILPFIQQLNRGYVFTNNFNLAKSSGEANSNTQYTATLSYNNFNIQRRGYFMFVFYMLSSSPVNYINNIFQQNNLFFNALSISQQYNPFQSINFSFTKSLNRINSTIIQNISVGSFANNSLIANQKSKNTSLMFNFETRLKTNWKKWININTAIIYKTQNQTSALGSIILAENTGTDFLTNTLISVAMKKKLFVDFQTDFLLNRSFNNETRSILFFDVKIRYIASKKITLDFLARNIFNKTNFVYNDASMFYNSTNTFLINQKLGILSLNYKL